MRRILFETLDDVGPMISRERSGREARTSAEAIDGQWVEAPTAYER
jgi:hypothetical protein